MKISLAKIALACGAIFVLSADLSYAQEWAERCASLGSTDFSGVPDAPTQITSAKASAATDQLPAFCEVKGYVVPNVGFEMRLPASGWNKRFLMQGCGGFCGFININGCNDALLKTYAVIASDMGHKSTGLDGKWAYNNRQAEIDFGYRATHVTAVAGKAIVTAFYGEPAAYSYYRGCSTGGRQGLVEAQQFPEDFDGIVVGAPPMNEVREAVYGIGWPVRVSKDDNGNQILTADKLPILHAAAVDACDMTDGLKDGIIGDPLSCDFDPGDVECRNGNEQDCLTADQVRVVRLIYEGAKRDDGTPLMPGGPPPGSEMRWAGYLGVSSSAGGNLKQMYDDFLRYMAFSEDPGPSYDVDTFDYDRDGPRLQFMERLYNAENPDLRPFNQRNGKMILYMGLQDSFAPERLTDYYDTVTRIVGGEDVINDFFKLYLIPGMGHCSGGPGVDTIDWLSAIEAWVERDEAPDMLTGYKMKEGTRGYNMSFPVDSNDIAFTRPLYPYPDRAVYKGDGDPNAAESFERARQ